MKSCRPLLIVLALLLACFSLTSLITFISPPLVQAAPQAAIPRYVAPGGTDTGNTCTTALTPCATLQHAVQAALPGDEIRVAGGVYSDVRVTADLTQVLFISQSIVIHGGYASTFTAQPDPERYPTRLDARGLGRVVVISGPVSVTLAGLQVTGGAALSATADRGGGIYTVRAYLQLSQTAVYSNRAGFGGGIYAQQVTGTITGSVVQGNEARYGGGIYWQSGELALTGLRVEGNVALISGGGARLYDSTARLAASEFRDNQSTLSGGGIYASLSSITLTTSLLQGNVVSGTGQGWGGGLHLNSSRAWLAGNDLFTNTAPVGGGGRFFNGTAILTGNRFRGNHATNGGALSLEAGTTATLTNQVFVHNTAVSGAAFQASNSTSHWRHTTFSANGGANAVAAGSGTTLFFTNTIFYSHALGVQNNGGQINMAATLWDATAPEVDGPVTQSDSRRGAAALAPDGFHLTPASLAIEAGIDIGVATDIDGQPRPFSQRPDAGAVEYTGLIVRKQVSPATIGPGQTATYTLAMTNVTGISISVALTDLLPALVTYTGGLTASSGTAVYTTGVIMWSGLLPHPGAVQIQWRVQVDGGILPGTTIRNEALIDTGTAVFPSNAALLIYPARNYLPIIRAGGA